MFTTDGDEHRWVPLGPLRRTAILLIRKYALHASAGASFDFGSTAATLARRPVRRREPHRYGSLKHCFLRPSRSVRAREPSE
jgi:hypothetical protein